MDPSKHEMLIASIYEAAVVKGDWRQPLIALAGLTDCIQVSIDVYDRSSGYLITGNNPLLQPEYVASYVDYWRFRFSFWKRNAAVPPGRILRSSEIFDDRFWKGDFYNEWSKPQGIAREGRYVNLALTGRAIAMLRACKREGRADFSPDEHGYFESAAGHFTRALLIHRRLRLAEAQKSALAGGEAPGGFLIVDRMGRVLTANEQTGRRLHTSGLISSPDGADRIQAENPLLERLICGTAGARGGRVPRAGEVEHRGRDGSLLKITVIPVVQTAWPVEPWLAIDQPAAILYVTSPEDEAKARIVRLAAEFGLTPAEAAVAIETAKGDGRAAVAARLNIRETTVRSHLSAIFDKLDIHRQAELTRLVAGA